MMNVSVDDFNHLLENKHDEVKAFADRIGGTICALRILAELGKLNEEAFIGEAKEAFLALVNTKE